MCVKFSLGQHCTPGVSEMERRMFPPNASLFRFRWGIKKEDTSFDVSSSKGAVTYSPDFSVPSARRGLTSLFGMGRGGTLVLWPPYSLFLFLFPLGNSLPALCDKNHRLEANALLRPTNFRRDFFAVRLSTAVLFPGPPSRRREALRRKLSGN